MATADVRPSMMDTIISKTGGRAAQNCRLEKAAILNRQDNHRMKHRSDVCRAARPAGRAARQTQPSLGNPAPGWADSMKMVGAFMRTGHFDVEIPIRKLLIFSGGSRLIANHQPLSSSKACREIRPLPFHQTYPASSVVCACPPPPRSAVFTALTQVRQNCDNPQANPLDFHFFGRFPDRKLSKHWR